VTINSQSAFDLRVLRVEYSNSLQKGLDIIETFFLMNKYSSVFVLKDFICQRNTVVAFMIGNNKIDE